MGKDLIKVILYGSCARGDYTQGSDVDIALITACDRMEAKMYNDKIANISMQLAMKYFAVVNFVCLPYAEFMNKKSWYLYFQNIFIYKGVGIFTSEEYQKIAGAEQIRNASDYDDFYIASKDETRRLVENTEYIVNKMENYIAERTYIGEFSQMQETGQGES